MLRIADSALEDCRMRAACAARISGVIYARWSAVRSVVVAGRKGDDLCLGDDIDEAVLVIDPPGPWSISLPNLRA
jgi:hypothetical protein